MGSSIHTAKNRLADFSQEFTRLPLTELVERSRAVDGREFDRAFRGTSGNLERFAALISPEGGKHMEALAARSRDLTRQRFGKVMRFFAPVYLSNECVNNCKYCGFSRDNPILRVTLSVDEVVREARELWRRGFRHLLLVSGEHPKFASAAYMAECIRALRMDFPSLALEVGPMEEEDYRTCVGAGAEALVVYQETYDREVYEDVHTSGPKRDFDWRLDTAGRAYRAGFRRLGIGALYGLSDWRYEALAVAAHAQYLQKHCWKAQVTVSVPRLRPHAGEFEPLTHLADRELVQLICAYRLFLPDVGIVLSTRERAALRNGLIPLGVTHLSAGSHTDPGGYTGAGRENLHLTRRGRIENTGPVPGGSAESCARATGQFEIADERSTEEVAEFVRRLGYDVVWKDWDESLASSAAESPGLS